MVLVPSHRRTTGYVVKYIGFILYGLHASIKGVTTISETTSADWAFVWPILVSVLASFALVGVIRTRNEARPLLEIVATILLLAHLCTYSLYILLRAYSDGDGFVDAASMWLPILLCVFPFRRLVGLIKPINLPRWAYRLARRHPGCGQ